jgi:hypothetical protein
MHIAIEAALAGGERVSAICRQPKGSWGVPPLTPADHREKLVDCFNRALPAALVGELVALFERLETLDAGGVAQIAALIALSPQRQ